MNLIFPPKIARDPRQRDMAVNFWTAPTAWFQEGTTKLRGLPPSPQWLPTGALWKDSTWSFSSTGHLLENHF